MRDLRQRACLGAPKAITATAHKLARIIDAMLRYGVAYQKKSEDEYVAQHRLRMENNLHRRAHELGDELKKARRPTRRRSKADASLSHSATVSEQQHETQEGSLTR